LSFSQVSLIFLFLILSFSFIAFFYPVFAEGIASIWTTDEAGNLKTDFSPESTVYIRGENFLPNNSIQVNVTRPDAVIDTGLSSTDLAGNFLYAYLLDGIEGTYLVYASDGTNTAEITFTDSITQECRDFNFDFAVVKWEWDDGWSPEGGDANGTTLTGNNTLAHWNVGTSQADGIIIKAGKTVHYAILGSGGTLDQNKPALSHITFCGHNYFCDANRQLTTFMYESKPKTAYVDSNPTNVAGSLCSGNFNVNVDTSDGKEHYIYLNWNSSDINISSYDGAEYFDLLLYHYEVSTIIKVQLKNDSNVWIDVCDPAESGSAVWSQCDLKPYLNILKNVPVIQLRIVAKMSGTCHEYLGCAKLKTKLYKCKSLCDNVDCSYLNNQCQSGICNESDGQCYPDYSNYPLSTQCNNGTYCDGADHCDGQGSCVAIGTPIDCSNLNDQCNNGVCDENTDSCKKIPVQNGTSCNDGLWCNEGEVCINGACSNGSSRDCTYNDISLIASCLWNPDNINFTWDYRNPFTSICDETKDICTAGDETIGHECSVDPCGAECEQDSDCLCQPDGCIGRDYYDYPDHSTCENCECTTCTPTISYNDPQCGECLVDADCPSTGNQCTENKCVNYWCVETPKQISTPCEGDGDLCTIDHCDGAGQCVKLDEVDCSGYSNQCNTGLCNPQTGSCYSDPLPYSTSCDNELYCDGIDHCDGLGECVPLGPSINCSYLNDQCNTGICNEQIDDCVADPKPLSTPCENGLYCDGPDHCDGSGSCVNLGPVIDCSSYNLPPVGQCDYVPDGFPFTWDYFIGFNSTCNEGTDSCDTGTEEITSDCSMQNCNAECESNSDCTARIENDYCYYNGGCSEEPSCSCSYDSEFCPEPGTVIEGFCYWGERECTNGRGCDINKTAMGCNQICDPEKGPTGLPELHTQKEITGTKIACNYYGDANEAKDCYFVTQETKFSLATNYSNNVSTYYRQRLKQDYDSNWGSWGNWALYSEPFSKAEDSIHELEYYSIDNDCNLVEAHNFEIDIVDSKAPDANKIVGEPKVHCTGEDCSKFEWKITMLTPIILSCSDVQPHPSGKEKVCYRYYLDGTLKQDWVCEDSPKTLYFKEECLHKLEFYCEDGLGNKGTIDSEFFKVEGTALRIPLFKKWNLISVPFVLLDNDIGDVFKDIDENINSVWAYDSVNDLWLVYRPSDPVHSSLKTIEPGLGYWVLAKEDTELKIGGSLFSPAVTPPSKPLVKGWNLIGYYGTEWQSYEDDPFCEYGGPYAGNYAFCALNSLVDTQEAGPKWSSLWGYINCGDDNTQWISLATCGNYDKMYAGKGYWIEMDANDFYAPASTCIWNKELYCGKA